jgi:hypothetical protein
LEWSGLPPLAGRPAGRLAAAFSPLREFAKIKSNGEGKTLGKAPPFVAPASSPAVFQAIEETKGARQHAVPSLM